MNARSTWSLAAVAVVAAAVALFSFWPRDRASERSASASQGSVQQPQRPRTPPAPGDRPTPVPMPEMPPNVREMQARIFTEAKAAGEERPGDKAFRATVDAFMEYNRHFAEAQAKDEGITVKEVESSPTSASWCCRRSAGPTSRSWPGTSCPRTSARSARS